MKVMKLATTIIPMIGNPVAQAATPKSWNEYFSKSGIDALCVPIQLKSEGLPAFFEWIKHADNIPGFVSTIPHKSDLPGLCDHQKSEVQILGVANTIRKTVDGTFECAMFDGAGMISAVCNTGCEIEGGSVLVIGSGAAGSAIGLEALNCGAQKLVILDRVQSLADKTAEMLTELFPDRVIETQETSNSQYNAIINASPQGSACGDRIPYDLQRINGDTILADAITVPNPTKWIVMAREKGHRTITGSEMAAAQANLMRNFIGMVSNN